MQGELAARKAALTELKAEVSALKDEITKARGGEALSATKVDSPYSSTSPLNSHMVNSPIQFAIQYGNPPYSIYFKMVNPSIHFTIKI